MYHPTSTARAGRLLAVVATLLAGGLLWLLAGLPRTRPMALEPAQHALRRSPEPATPEVVPAVARHHEPPPAPAPAGENTARAFLAEYYGSRWPDIERAMESANASLDVSYSFTPWEEVEPAFQQAFPVPSEELQAMAQRRLAWPEELSLAWVEENYPTGRPPLLREEDLPLLAEAVSGANAELLRLAEEWVTQIDFLVRLRVQNGDYLRSPYTTLGLSQERGFFSKSIGASGWAATLTLTREDHPEMVALEQTLYAQRDRRDEIVIAFLRQRSGR